MINPPPPALSAPTRCAGRAAPGLGPGPEGARPGRGRNVIRLMRVFSTSAPVASSLNVDTPKVPGGDPILRRKALEMTSSLSSTARRLLAGAALACAAACAAGCASTTPTTAGGAASTGAGSSASASASAASQSPAGGGVTVTATPGGANANAAGPQSCATRSLSAKLGNGQGAAGSTYVDIVFTNIGSASCTLYGYP